MMYHLTFTEHGRREWGRGDRSPTDSRVLTPIPCAYCAVEIPKGAARIFRRVSHGFGAANDELVYFCSRTERGLYFERGPKWSVRENRSGLNARLDEFTDDELAVDAAERAEVIT